MNAESVISESGLQGHPGGTLVDKALQFLRAGPADSNTLARDVMGLKHGPTLVADRVVVALLGADPRVQRLGDGRWALTQLSLGSPKLADCAFAVVDVETTGNSPGQGDRIVEIAVVAVAGDKVELTYNSLVNPERPIPRFTSALTKITQPMVQRCPTFDEMADDIMAALAGRVFVAHNARFDWQFVGREMRSARDMVLSGPRLCTVDLTRRLVPGLRSRSLDSVANYFSVEINDRHRAAGDALATARVLLCLLDLASERGAQTLDDLRRMGIRRKKRGRSALPRSMDDL
ncbi:MAG: 3'-5' exonuclease [Gemmatimonadota bacterium]|nr:MAG: 3'-5' exonuclease [Gemmatimonadota bacterium]